MPLDQLAQALAVLIFHMNELDAAAIRPEITDHRREVNLAQPGTNFQLNGIADAQPIRGFHVSPAHADRLHPRHAHLWTGDLSPQRGLERNTRITAGDNEIAKRRSNWFKGGAHPRGARTFLQ